MTQDKFAKTVSRNSLYSGIYYVWYLGSRLLITPLVLAYITIQEYGLWSYCFVVLGYLALSAFGFNNTYIRYTAYYRSRGEDEKVNELISTGLITMMSIATVLFAVLWFIVPWLIRMLGIDAELHDTATGLLIGTAAIFVVNMGAAGYQYILEGEQQIALVRKIQIVATVLEIVLIVVFLKAGFGVMSLLMAYIVRSSTSILLSIFFAHRVLPFLRISPAFYSKDVLKKFTGYGNQMNLLGLLALLINSLDRVFITRMLHLEAVGIYEVGRKLPGMGLMLPASMAGSLMPAASHLDGSQQFERLKNVYLVSTRYIMIISALPFSFLIMLAPQVIEIWVGKGYEQSTMIMQVLATGTFINLFTAIGTSCVRGIGKPIYEIKYMLVSLFLILILMPVMIYKMGLIGAACAFSFSQMVGSVYFIIIANRLFGTSYSKFLSQIVVPVIIIFSLSIPSYFLCRFLWTLGEVSRWSGLGILSMVFAFYLFCVLLTFCLLQRYLLSGKERGRIRSAPLPVLLSGVWKKMWRCV